MTKKLPPVMYNKNKREANIISGGNQNNGKIKMRYNRIRRNNNCAA
jgi:hypothetical protein